MSKEPYTPPAFYASVITRTRLSKKSWHRGTHSILVEVTAKPGKEIFLSAIDFNVAPINLPSLVGMQYNKAQIRVNELINAAMKLHKLIS